MDKKQDFLNAAKNSLCVWCCEMSDTQEYNLKNFIKKAMEKIEEAYDAGYRAAQGITEKEEKNTEIPGVIIVTDEIKKMFPELKNISMIQTEPVSDKTWPEAMEYAKNLKLGGFTDWRLPTCSGDEDDRSVNNELCGIWRARKVLGIPEDYRQYWSGTEFDASSAWYVYFDSSGYVSSYNKSGTCYVRCVRQAMTVFVFVFFARSALARQGVEIKNERFSAFCSNSCGLFCIRLLRSIACRQRV